MNWRCFPAPFWAKVVEAVDIFWGCTRARWNECNCARHFWRHDQRGKMKWKEGVSQVWHFVDFHVSAALTHYILQTKHKFPSFSSFCPDFQNWCENWVLRSSAFALLLFWFSSFRCRSFMPQAAWQHHPDSAAKRKGANFTEPWSKWSFQEM